MTARAQTSTNPFMSDEPVNSLIPYDEIVQEALRAVVGRVLGDVAANGLPGEHHFYITFRTSAPGVSIPRHLVERFPEEMTIVLQHQFRDLLVSEDGFEIGLSFGGVPSHLSIPFAAITAFHDPAVDFALQFHVDAMNDDDLEHDAAENDAQSDEQQEAERAAREDGSNVVAVDFSRKK